MLPLAVINSTLTTIPPGGIMEPTGVTDEFGRIEVQQPSSDDSLAVIINGPTPILAGDAGTGYLPWFGPLSAAVDPTLLDTDGALITPATVFGVEAGNWYLTDSHVGFVSQGVVFGGLIPVQAKPSSIGGLATRNVNGTQSGTTNDLRFDQATGSHKRPRTGGELWDTHELLPATPAQMGAIQTLWQWLGGPKDILGNGWLGVFLPRPGGSSGMVASDHIETFNVGTPGGGFNMGVRAQRVLYASSSGPILDGNSITLAFVPSVTGAGGGTGGYMVLGGGWGSSPQPVTVSYAAVDGTGTVRPGITRNFASGEYPIVVGGIVVDYWSGSGSPPPVPPTPTIPPPPVPPIPPPPDTGSISGQVTHGAPTYAPVSGRTLTLDGVTTTTTNSQGNYSFGGVSAGSHTVVLSSIGGETARWFTGGGSGNGYSAGVVVIADESSPLSYLVTP